jgi:hypothetical protein
MGLSYVLETCGIAKLSVLIWQIVTKKTIMRKLKFEMLSLGPWNLCWLLGNKQVAMKQDQG